ncbi:LexA family protein [Brochothrix thermosphacta]|uniref:LexA family protein n=1 Tax=Brochothrix thermosphacta TaxID=2756 RepID=UPI00083FC54C|nr:XRE family transcriptional regulator [Brochothrix thermosphacta]ODJ73371.1 hypothetical protein BFR39_03375 [Brochothrix thermosphacta]
MNSLGNKNIMAKNIDKHMKKRGISRRKLSADLGISYTTVTDWINAKTYPRIDKIEMMANYFGINKSDLVEESPTHHVTPIKENTTEIKTLPLYGNVAAGAIAEIEGVDVWNVETIDIPSVMLGRYANDDHLFSMYVNGDSMNQVIPNGSIIVAKPLEDYMYKDGDIVIFNHDAEYSLKTYRPNMIDGFVVFEPNSDNAGFKNIAIDHTTLHDANMVSISGKVIFFSTIL